jgi:hypothetical protein
LVFSKFADTLEVHEVSFKKIPFKSFSGLAAHPMHEPAQANIRGDANEFKN